MNFDHIHHFSSQILPHWPPNYPILYPLVPKFNNPSTSIRAVHVLLGVHWSTIDRPGVRCSCKPPDVGAWNQIQFSYHSSKCACVHTYTCVVVSSVVHGHPWFLMWVPWIIAQVLILEQRVLYQAISPIPFLSCFWWWCIFHFIDAWSRDN